MDKHEISKWFDEGIRLKAAYLLIIHDHRDFMVYPVHVLSKEEMERRVSESVVPWSQMHVMKVYDLQLNKTEQLTAPLPLPA